MSPSDRQEHTSQNAPLEPMPRVFRDRSSATDRSVPAQLTNKVSVRRGNTLKFRTFRMIPRIVQGPQLTRERQRLLGYLLRDPVNSAMRLRKDTSHRSITLRAFPLSLREADRLLVLQPRRLVCRPRPPALRRARLQFLAPRLVFLLRLRGAHLPGRRRNTTTQTSLS